MSGRAIPEISCPRRGTCRTVISKPASQLKSNFMAGNLPSGYLLRRESCKESRDTFRFLVASGVPRPPFFTGNLSCYCVLVMYPLVGLCCLQRRILQMYQDAWLICRHLILNLSGTLVLRLQSCTSLTFGSEITKISGIPRPPSGLSVPRCFHTGTPILITPEGQ